MDAALTRRERMAVWLLTLVVAATRWPAVSLTLWDWDEALFALALRDYDVVAHHPHPPGFPLFIALAKLIPLDEFHALQSVTVAASLFVFPVMFFLARELRFSAMTSIGAGLLLAFFPNVWFFGGTAFSDVPSLVLILLASALLLRGRRSNASLLLGAIMLGIAAGFRPQNLLIGFVPLLLAGAKPETRNQKPEGDQETETGSWRLPSGFWFLVSGLSVAIVVASYGGAAAFSGGWDAYREALVRHESYIREVDSFLGPARPGLIQVADDFFVRPYRAPLINVVIALLALAGLVRLRKRAALALLIFGPFLLFAWLYLDFHSASRFSIGYMPLFALLAASAIPARALTAVIALLVLWTWPALRVVHTTVSPPVAAIESIRGMGNRVIYVDERLAAHAALLLPESDRRVVRVTPPLIEDANAVLLREGMSVIPGARNFTRARDRLDGVSRKRYFEVSVVLGRRPR